MQIGLLTLLKALWKRMWLVILAVLLCGAAAASLLTQAATILAAPMLIPAMRENTRLMLQAILLRDVLPRRETADNAKSS